MSLFLPNEYHTDIYKIDLESLAQRGIRGFICDIDNTLEPYETPEPTPKLRAWMKKANSLGISISFVSNNHSDRVDLFNRSLGYFAKADAAKPLTKNIKLAMKAMDCDKKSCAMLGDQIFTDILAGKLAGLYGILVCPIKDKKTLLFRFKRALEKPLLRIWRMKNKTDYTETTRKITK